jgi:hypothetical protein
LKPRHLAIATLLCAGSALAAPTTPGTTKGLKAFETVRKVFQHPRCRNCHIPGDAPLQFDDGRVHGQSVVRGADGHGAVGLKCATCHGAANLPASYGPHVPPGAPSWHLPPPEHKMVFIGKNGAELCALIKDPDATNGKDLPAMLEHVTNDSLVRWGWEPGVGRAPVDVPHAEFVSAFREWIEKGAHCPVR